ncbi:MAG TPA: hypothetical protein VKU36_03165, partial [Candidatus Babeliales bacterium]|nr:hypothetical protein [Candidatus Babeliales bacterium]
MKRYVFIIACLVTQAYAMEQSEQLDLVKLQLEKGLVRVGFARLLGNIHSYEENSLVGGFSGNAPYRCKVNNTNYVVRTFKDNALEVREIKVDINRLVGEKKIGPQIHYYAHHDDFSYIIMDFIDTSTLSLDQASCPIILECVAKQARAIADFDPNMVTHHKENILQETLRHYETLKNKNVTLFEPLLQELKIKIDTVHQKIEQENRPMVINHNDFYTRNM